LHGRAGPDDDDGWLVNVEELTKFMIPLDNATETPLYPTCNCIFLSK
jgi:hypothetical protein